MKKLWALPHLPGVLTHQIGDDGGAFALRSPTDRKPMQIIASNGEGWDHVSVSRTDRVPNWEEMEHVKRLFFEDWEVAMQLHRPARRPYQRASQLPAYVATAERIDPNAAGMDGGVMGVVSQRLRDSAKRRECTLQFSSCCNHNPGIRPVLVPPAEPSEGLRHQIRRLVLRCSRAAPATPRSTSMRC